MRKQILQRLLEARRMRHQIAHRDRLAVARRNGEIQILVHVRIEIELALLDQLHHCRPQERLGDRARTKQCGCRIDLFIRRNVGVAIPSGHQNLAVLHHHNDRRRQIVLGQSVGKQAIEPCACIVRRQRMAADRHRNIRLCVLQRFDLDLCGAKRCDQQKPQRDKGADDAFHHSATPAETGTV